MQAAATAMRVAASTHDQQERAHNLCIATKLSQDMHEAKLASGERRAAMTLKAMAKKQATSNIKTAKATQNSARRQAKALDRQHAKDQITQERSIADALRKAERVEEARVYRNAMLKVDNDHAERTLKAEADSEVDWAYIQADMHSDKLLGAAAARWQASLARARNSLEEQEAHQTMDTYARSKGWETKWAEWKSDWLLEVINAHEAGECTDLDKREYIYHQHESTSTCG